MITNVFAKKSNNKKKFRTLTENEIAFAQDLFNDSIRYEYVEVYNKRFYPTFFQNKNRAVAYKNQISAPGQSYSDDFGLSENPIKKSVFIHEIFHIWQYQNDVLDPRIEFAMEMISRGFNHQACYRYKLHEGKDLLNYNFEQQPAIVQDYFLLKKFDIESSYKNRHLRKMDKTTLLNAYESVLKNFLDDPSYARMHEAQKYSKGFMRYIPVPKESRFYFPEKSNDLWRFFLKLFDLVEKVIKIIRITEVLINRGIANITYKIELN